MQLHIFICFLPFISTLLLGLIRGCLPPLQHHLLSSFKFSHQSVMFAYHLGYYMVCLFVYVIQTSCVWVSVYQTISIHPAVFISCDRFSVYSIHVSYKRNSLELNQVKIL